MINGRLLQEELDKRIDELESIISKLKRWRIIMNNYTFYECEKHGVYGIRAPDPIICKMCKRLGNDNRRN